MEKKENNIKTDEYKIAIDFIPFYEKKWLTKLVIFKGQNDINNGKRKIK